MKAFVGLVLVLALAAPGTASAQTAPEAKPPTCRLSANASAVPPNTRVRLDWQTTNAQSGYLTDVGAIAPNGTAYVVPGKNTTYAASFTGPGGSVVCRVAVAVRAGASLPSGGTIGPPIYIDTNHPIDINKPINLDLDPVQFGPVETVSPSPSGSGGTGFLGSLVPAECRISKTNALNTVQNCDLCAMMQMVQNILNFLLGLTVPAAALLFAWAGILYFSSRGNPVQISKAHKIFKTVAIGFLIAIAAWIIVNTIVNVLVTGTAYKDWSWKSLNCTATRILRQEQTKKSIEEYLRSSLPGLVSYTPPAGGSAYECNYGTLQNGRCYVDGTDVGAPALIKSSNSANLTCEAYGSAYAISGTQCYSIDADLPAQPALRKGQLTEDQTNTLTYECNDFGIEESCDKLSASVGATSGNALAGVQRWNTQIAEACIREGMGDCRVVQAIMTHESGGDCNARSGAGAMGCMQVMPTTACSVDPSISGCSTCTRWDYNKGSPCSEVANALRSNPVLNINTGTKLLTHLYNKYDGDIEKIAAAYNGGEKANNGSRTCAGVTVWECGANDGYRETRKYVPLIKSTYAVLSKK